MILGLLLALLLVGLPLPALGAVLCETPASAESDGTVILSVADSELSVRQQGRAQVGGSRCDVQWPPRLHPRPAPPPISDPPSGDAALVSHDPLASAGLRSGADSLLLPTPPALHSPQLIGFTATRAGPLRCSQADPRRLERPPR